MPCLRGGTIYKLDYANIVNEVFSPTVKIDTEISDKMQPLCHSMFRYLPELVKAKCLVKKPDLD